MLTGCMSMDAAVDPNDMEKPNTANTRRRRRRKGLRKSDNSEFTDITSLADSASVSHNDADAMSVFGLRASDQSPKLAAVPEVA